MAVPAAREEMTERQARRIEPRIEGERQRAQRWAGASVILALHCLQSTAALHKMAQAACGARAQAACVQRQTASARNALPCQLGSSTLTRNRQQAGRRRSRHACPAAAEAAAPAAAVVRPEADVPHLSAFLDGLKWDSNGLVVAIAQHVDTGEVLMQAFADRAAVSETLQSGCVCVRGRGWGGRAAGSVEDPSLVACDRAPCHLN